MDELFEKAKAKGISSYSAVGFMPYSEDANGRMIVDLDVAADKLAYKRINISVVNRELCRVVLLCTYFYDVYIYI